MSIRNALPSDIPALMALDRHAVTAAHWSESQYHELFNAGAPERLTLVLEQEGLISGFVVGRCVGDEWEIENVAIAGSARRRGLGTRLLGEFLEQVRLRRAVAVFLEVRESNAAARALYEKWSFRETGTRPRYYNNPIENAVTYRIDFS